MRMSVNVSAFVGVLLVAGVNSAFAQQVAFPASVDYRLLSCYSDTGGLIAQHVVTGDVEINQSVAGVLLRGQEYKGGATTAGGTTAPTGTPLVIVNQHGLCELTKLRTDAEVQAALKAHP